jgi:hypothetical protein
MKATILFSICVAICNIALNDFTRRAALSAGKWQSSFATPYFLLAFIIGLASVAFLVSVYFSAKGNTFGLANGILLMGMTSVIVGTMYGIVTGSKLHWSEWAVFVLMLMFSIVRYWNVLSPKSLP